MACRSCQAPGKPYKRHPTHGLYLAANGEPHRSCRASSTNRGDEETKMFGFRYLKSPPTRFVVEFRDGVPRRSGLGKSFYYFAPLTTIVSVDQGSVDVPFVFQEVTADFQDVTLQGQLTYRVVDPQRLAGLLNHVVNERGTYVSDDPSKVGERLVQHLQVRAHHFTQTKSLSELLLACDELSGDLLASLRGSDVVTTHGLEVLALAVLSIKPTPEMAKAMQAGARERLLQQADEAVYARRNAAIELERQVQENEIDTERVVEEKRRQVRQAQMEADVAVERQRAELVDQQVANRRKLAGAEAEALQETLGAIKQVDWKILAALAGKGQARSMIAMAFHQLAENAQRIGRLDITPDLLRGLIDEDPTGATDEAE